MFWNITPIHIGLHLQRNWMRIKANEILVGSMLKWSEPVKLWFCNRAQNMICALFNTRGSVLRIEHFMSTYSRDLQAFRVIHSSSLLYLCPIFLLSYCVYRVVEKAYPNNLTQFVIYSWRLSEAPVEDKYKWELPYVLYLTFVVIFIPLTLPGLT